MIQRIFLVFIVLFFTSCNSIVQKVADNVKYDVVDYDIDLIKNSKNLLDSFLNVDFQSMTKVNIVSYVKLSNFNFVDIVMDKIEYDILIDDILIASGVKNDEITIQSNGNTTIQLPITVNLNSLIGNGINILKNFDQDNIKIVGRSHIDSSLGDFIIPFKLENNKSFIGEIIYE